MAQESRLVIVIDAKNAERNARNLGNELESIERKGDFATKSMDALSVATRQLAGYMAGLVTVSAAISKMDTYTGLQNRLKLVTNNQVELNKATEDTFNIAQATGQSWDSTAQVYQRFADNAKRLGITLQQTSVLTETVAKAISISGASAASAEAALVQFGQALASGVLRGEEFNSISEQAPGLLKAIATGLNVNIGELRAMAAEGKLTADVVIKSLEEAKVSVDDLFNKTDFTIGNSFTMLNNAVTQFVGEAGKGSGAAQVLAGTIQTLASNLDVLTSAMMVGGAYWLGTYIPAIYASGVAVAAKTKELAVQTVTQYAAIQAERAAAAQQVISTQAAVANTQATLAAIAAEKALEVQRLKSQITEKGRTATLTRMAELKKIEAQVTRELAVAEGALATAQARSAAAGAASVGIGSRLLGLLGGPVGIGITVASLAAGYMYLQQRADDANKKLEEQGKIADRTRSELEKLNGVERKSAVNDLTTAFDAQNKALEKSRLAVGSALIDIQNYEKGNWKVVEVINQANKGTISYSDAITQLNDMKISPDLYNALKKQVEQYDANYEKANKSATALKIFGVEVVVAGNKAQNAAIQHNLQSEALEGTALAANKATKALQDFQNKQKESAFESLYKQGYLEKGFTIEQTNAIYELQKAKGESAILSKQEIDSVLRNVNLTQQLKDKQDAILESKRASLRESKKQTSEYQKQQKQADRIKEQQAQSRATISYDFADDFKRIGIEYQRQVKDISEANFKEEHDKYMQFAKQRYDFETWMYLRQLTEENDSFRWSEEYKLKFFYETQREMVSQSGRFNDEMKDLRIQKLNEQEQQELALIKLAQEQRLFQIQQSYLHEVDSMRERYRLERLEIEKTKDAVERSRLLNASYRAEDNEYETKRQGAWNTYQGMKATQNGTGAYFQLDQAKNTADANVSEALKYNLITDEEAKADLLKNEEEFLRARLDLNLSFGEQIAGSYADMFKNMLGEQSAAYKAMFVVEKAAAIARSTVAIQAGIALAAENPFPLNLAAMATVAAETASIISNIQSATMTVSGKGFATGGYTGNMGRTEVAGVVHGQEYVLNAAATKRVGVDTLNAINSGGSLERTVSSSEQPVTIQVYVTDSGVNTNGANTQDQKQLGQMIGNAVRTIIRQEQRQGGLLSR